MADAAKLREVVRRVNEKMSTLSSCSAIMFRNTTATVPIAERDLRMPDRRGRRTISRVCTARYGVVAVLGNHDGWFNDQRVASELTRVGYRVLQNELFTIETKRPDARFLGLDRPL